MNTWFTADHHFGHANIITYCNRPFYSAGEMDEAMVARWNEVVRPDDVVYHLGDLTLSKDIRYVAGILERLNGVVRLVPGGHDKWVNRITSRWEGDVFSRKLQVLPPLVILPLPGQLKKVVVSLCHYPMLSWERSHHGMPHFHGHSHGGYGITGGSGDGETGGRKRGVRIDVGVDCWDFYPVHLNTLSEVIHA